MVQVYMEEHFTLKKIIEFSEITVLGSCPPSTPSGFFNTGDTNQYICLMSHVDRDFSGTIVHKYWFRNTLLC